MSVAEYEEKVAYLQETSAQHERHCPDLAMLCTVVIGPSREQLYQELDRRPLLKLWGLQASGDAWTRLGLEHPFGDTSKGMFDVVIRDIPARHLRELAPELPSEIVGECYFMGNADEIFRELVAFRRAGMERAILCNSFVVPPQNEAEKQKIFNGQPLLACLSLEIPRPGDRLLFDAAAHPTIAQSPARAPDTDS